MIRGVGQDWEIREIELDPPHSGEVLVRIAVAGICHSDDHLFTGDVVPTPEAVAASGQPAPDWFPLLGGHEGAGVVEEVGPGVTTVQPGDHVALSFIPACGSCRFCVNGQSYICDIGASLFVREMPTDGTCRRHLGDENLLAYGQLGTFAEYAVLSERSVIKIDDAIPF
ncbi:alcohol dehydrogenase catalytic domain-containing protein, partial [Mycobacterium montefiorense]